MNINSFLVKRNTYTWGDSSRPKRAHRECLAGEEFEWSFSTYALVDERVALHLHGAVPDERYWLCSLILYGQVRWKPIWRCCSWRRFPCGLKPLSAPEAIQMCAVADLNALGKARSKASIIWFGSQLEATCRSSERFEYLKNEGFKECRGCTRSCPG